MKKMFREFIKLFEFIATCAHQVAYVGFSIAALFFIYNIRPFGETVTCILFVILHFISIAVSGSEISVSSFERAKGIRVGLIIFNVVLIGFVIILTNSLYILLLALYMLVIGSIYLYVTLHYIHSAFGKEDNELSGFSHKHKNIFCTIVLAIPVIAIIISLIFVPCNIYMKIGIVWVYTLSMPFIAMAAVSGFDIKEVFLKEY